MARRKFSKWTLITVACLFLVLAPVNYPSLTSAQTSPAASPSPPTVRTSEVKRPNPVRRFFSWVIHPITSVFRRPQNPACSLPPIVDLKASNSLISFCPFNKICETSREVSLSADTSAPDDNSLLYTWNVTGGRLNGEGPKVTWDLSGLPEGSYTATVEVNAGNQLTAAAATTVQIAVCSICDKPPPPCPSVSVSYPSDFDLKRPITFEAIVKGGEPELTPTYTWSISAGKIISGQGTPKLTVDASNSGGQSLTATVALGGVDPSCTRTTASSTLPISDAYD